MFYDTKLMTNSLLKQPWRAAHCQEVKPNGNLKVSNMCEDLNGLLLDDGCSPLARSSLRVSSALINGTVRLLKTKADGLCKDFFKLSQQLEHYNYRSISSGDSEDHFIGSDDDNGIESSTTSQNGHTNDKVNVNETGLTDEDWDEFERSCMEIYSGLLVNSTNGSSVHENEVNNVPISTTDTLKRNTGNTNTSPTIRNDRAVQTSGNLNDKDSNNEAINELDPNSPFGLTLIFEKSTFLIPNKVLLSSLNASINNIEENIE